ncbi:hypothetical protein J5N97_002182 [Dioscorea zingiberensis]|uniref:EF-hand domain-containing protein n=1 Tax=Dioscorea zingiberensis TaxID=325984 RepID=A0A9D5D1P4_9LILI|nr:hypothetical protein J5N97_002182 [Dioscorea zingiberensis]
MTPFLLFFATIFFFGLINTFFFFSSPKFLSHLASLFQLPFSAKVPLEKEKEVVDVVLVEKTDLEKVFSMFDEDGDGFVTLPELRESLRRLGLLSTEKEVVSMMERVDASGDGLIDLNEFQKLYESIVRNTSTGSDQEEDMEMKEAFDVYDRDGDGLITVEELALVLSSLGLAGRVEDCKDMIRKVDLDGDGMVNFEEFKRMMMIKDGGKSF